MPPNAAAQPSTRPTWLEAELGRPPSTVDLHTFDQLVGTVRQSRETLVATTDVDVLRAAWRAENASRRRGTVLFQLRARLNALDASVETPSRPESRVVRPPFIEGTVTRPRGSTLTVPATDARSTLQALADGLPALRAMGVREIVIRLDED